MTKTKNIFDFLQTDPENINENTIYENTGVNADNVKEIVMKKIAESKSAPKKNRKKRWTITLIAAAAAVAVVGTTAAAAGSFHSVFGEWFAGEMEGGMYAGGNVQAQSDKLNIDFKGIAGDKHEVYGMMSITNKDGSPFVENTNDYFLAYTNYDTVDCTISLADQIANKLFYFGQEMKGGSITYQFEDTNTINAIITYGSNGYNIIGETLSASENQTTLCHVDKVLCTAEEIDAFWKSSPEVINSNETIFTKTSAEYQNKNPLKDNQEFMFTPKGDWAVVTQSAMELQYDLSVKLNYKDTTKYLDQAKGKTVSYNNVDNMTVTDLEAHAFGLKLDMVYPTDNMDEITAMQSKFDDNIINHVTVTMKDGTVYYAQEGGIYQSDNMQRINFHFSSDDWKSVVFNPDNIVKVVYNDVTLYSE